MNELMLLNNCALFFKKMKILEIMFQKFRNHKNLERIGDHCQEQIFPNEHSFTFEPFEQKLWCFERHNLESNGPCLPNGHIVQ